jgi:hypothetical protein
MKCKIFFGLWYEAQDAFNAWAKGKALTRDVLIHEQLMWTAGEPKTPCLLIIVYHPEDPFWDATEPTLTAPIHTKPEPHIKENEIVITQ